MRTYQTREAAVASKPFAAKSIGCAVSELVAVKHGARYRLTTRASLERWLSSKRAA
jgi:hypothetical protein